MALADTGSASAVVTLTHPSLLFSVTTGSHMFQFRLPWKTKSGTVGIGVGLLFQAFSSCNIAVRAPIAAAGVAAEMQNFIAQSGVMTLMTSAPTLDNNYCHIDGAITFTAAGTMHLMYQPEVATGASGPRLTAGGCGIIWAMQ